MICPKCESQLEATEHGGVPFDRCISCRGYWFDLFALESFLKKELPARHVGDVNSFMNPFGSEATERSCPRCQAKLSAYTHAGITVEWCQACRGLFLDEDEPAKIVAWRRANLAGQLKEVAKDAARETAHVAADVAITVLVAEALDGLFDKILGRNPR